ncbi:hypothetical protein H5410_061176, partial [Solanum commersonii]
MAEKMFENSLLREFTTCECGCVTWVDNGTHTEWPIFVDLQLGSPILVADGEKHNISPILP